MEKRLPDIALPFNKVEKRINTTQLKLILKREPRGAALDCTKVVDDLFKKEIED